MKPLRVMKFGGSSVASTEQIKAIAKKVAELKSAGENLIIVVSAMGKTTDQLTALAYEISPNPKRRELDMLISTGERVSMSLMAMALDDLNCASISLTGSQAGILTQGDFSNALISDLKPIRVDESLREGKVVVLAGFQGVNPITKEITTLGRGGSDTTAIALAAHYNAERCDILKDVDGIYSADPKLVARARMYKQLPIDVVLEMCYWGAKVLNYRSVELAQKNNVRVFIGRSDHFATGTEIIGPNDSKELSMKYEQYSLASVTSHKEIHHASLPCASLNIAMDDFSQLLKDHQLPMPQILACAFENQSARWMYTGDAALLLSIRNVLEKSSSFQIGKILSSVSMIFFGGVQNNTITKKTAELSQHSIPVEKLITSSISASFFVLPEHMEKTVQILHG
jgi:aspartate kinase